MSDKIKVSLVLNCVQNIYRGWLVDYYSDQVIIGDIIPTIYDKYEHNWEKYKKTRPDVVICNNIKDTNHPLSVNKLKLLFPKAQIIVCEFWRFAGFWPNKVIKNHPSFFWYDNTWDDYTCYESWIDQKISPGVIDRNYKESIDKLKQMEHVSDIKALDYIMDNHKHIQLFSDYWHPTKELFEHLFHQIIDKIGLDFIRPTSWPDFVVPRYMPILNRVSETLGLEFNSNCIWDRCTDSTMRHIQRYKYKLKGGISKPFANPREFYEWLHEVRKDP